MFSKNKSEEIKKGFKSLLGIKSKKNKFEEIVAGNDQITIISEINDNDNSLNKSVVSSSSNVGESLGSNLHLQADEKKVSETNLEQSIDNIDLLISEKASSDSQNLLNQTDEKENKKKAIFLIGSTGKGKSTLANVLINQVNQEGLFNNFQEVFKESGKSVSGTREVQEGSFIENGINYSIIDTVGLGDTKLPKEIVLDKIADAVYLAQQGVNQVFFVIDEKFNPHEMTNYDLLKNIIFDEQVVDYTTIIRTRFTDFKNKKECQTDIDRMIDQGGKLSEIINSCQKRVIYVDNPSLNLVPSKNETDERKKNREKKIADRKHIRNDSRKELIKHLIQINQSQTSLYQPPKLKKLNAELAETFKQKKDLEQKLQELKKKHSPISSPSLAKINFISTIITDSSLTLESELEILEETLSTDSNQNIHGIGESQHSKEKTKQLESEKEKLERGIAEKQNQIRIKIFKHILNNAESITEQLGGNNFLVSVTDDGNDWTKIHLDFTLTNKVKWLKKEFDFQQVQAWSQALESSFDPDHDVAFCQWLKNDKKLKPSPFPTQNLSSLRVEYTNWLTSLTHDLKEIKTNIAESDLNANYQGKTYRQWWVETGLTEAGSQEWLAVGLNVKDYKFADWLEHIGDLNPEQFSKSSDSEKEELREKYRTSRSSANCDNCGVSGINAEKIFFINRKKDLDFCSEACYKEWNEEKDEWTKISPKFLESGSRIYYWKKLGINYSEAEQWIKIGLSPSDYYEVVKWKEHNFTPSQAEIWKKIGLNEMNDIEFVVFLQNKNYQPTPDSHWAQIKEQGFSAQEYLDWKYPLEERNSITDLNVSDQNLVGELDCSDFVNLTSLDCDNNQLTKLNVGFSVNLKKLYCFNNQLIQLILPTAPNNLELLFCWGNFLTELDYYVLDSEKLTNLILTNNNLATNDLSCFNRFINLEQLSLGTESTTDDYKKRIKKNIYNRWVGSLNPLQQLTKLKILSISDTDINEGVEYLPNNIEEIYYSTEARPASKVKELTEQLDALVNTLNQRKVNNMYPDKDVKVMYLNNKNLQGQLDLSEYQELEELNCWENQLTSLELSKNIKLKELTCNNNKLSIINLKNNVNLQKLNCWDNQITQLLLTDTNQLTDIIINNNILTNLDYSALNPITLTKLSIWNNNLAITDLSVFSHLINLQSLDIGNDKENDKEGKITAGKFNRFVGSLESLKKLTKLTLLYIVDTDIQNGLEYLPNSLINFTYSSLVDSEFQVKFVEQQLQTQVLAEETYDAKQWKTYWQRLVKAEKSVSVSNSTELLTQIEQLEI